MRFHFFLADGSTCCRTDDARRLCPRCKTALTSNSTPSVPLREASLADRIQMVRGLPLLEVRAGRERVDRNVRYAVASRSI
jgi:hypothetical protein